MQEPAHFAYSLSQSESGWRWSVYDLDGEMVANGANSSQAAAQAEVFRLIQTPGGAND